MIDGGKLIIIPTYTPEDVGKLEKTEIFCEELQKQIDRYNTTDHLVILGNMNDRVKNNNLQGILGSF